MGKRFLRAKDFGTLQGRVPRPRSARPARPGRASCRATRRWRCSRGRPSWRSPNPAEPHAPAVDLAPYVDRSVTQLNAARCARPPRRRNPAVARPARSSGSLLRPPAPGAARVRAADCRRWRGGRPHRNGFGASGQAHADEDADAACDSGLSRTTVAESSSVSPSSRSCSASGSVGRVVITIPSDRSAILGAA
jgi:hypothetical protein